MCIPSLVFRGMARTLVDLAIIVWYVLTVQLVCSAFSSRRRSRTNTALFIPSLIITPLIA